MIRRILLFGLPLAAAVAGIFAFGGSEDGASAAEASEPTPQQRNATVATDTVEPAPAHSYHTYPGTVTASEQGTVSFTLGGRIDAVLVTGGQSVQADQPLAQLDRRPYRHALEQARAALQRVDAGLDQARTNLARAEQLGDATTEEELERRRTAVRKLEARRRQAQVAVSEAERELEETVLRAPYAGEIVRQLAERGEVVQPGTPVFAMSGNGEVLEVELALPERLFTRLDRRSALQVRFPLSPHIEPLTSRITSVAEHDGGLGGLFQITLTLGSGAKEAGVRSGLRAEVALPLAAAAKSVTVDPAAVVGRPDGTPMLYVVDGGVVRELSVDLHRARGNRVVVAPADTDGAGLLVPGATVVTAGQQTITEGQTVKVARK